MHEAVTRLKFDKDVGVLTPTFLRSRRWTLNEAAFPVIDVTFEGKRPLKVRLTCDQWDELPPSAELMKCDGTPIPVCHGADELGSTMVGVVNRTSHPSTGKVFVCTPGFREYHIHPSHLTDHWENYKGKDGNNLVGLLDQVSAAWRKATEI